MRVIKIFISLFTLLIIGFLTILFALHYYVSNDAIRIRLAQDLSAWTGYNVQLREAPKLSLFPYPRASLSGVTLTKMTNSTTVLMDAERIEVDLSLPDILFGKISFSKTRIIHPRFIMEEPIKTISDFLTTISNSEGTVGLAVHEAQEILRQNPNNFDAAQLLHQPFGRIIIENGEVQYRQNTNAENERIVGINATMRWPSTSNPLNIVISANWHGALSELSFEIAQPIYLLAGGDSQMKASFNSVRGGISFEGRGKLLHDYYLNGTIAALSPGLDQSLNWLGIHNDLIKNITFPVEFKSNFSAQENNMQFDNLTMTVAKDNARGIIELNYKQNIPAITGSLAFESLDINSFLSKLFPDNTHIQNLDTNLLKALSLDLRLSAPQIHIANTTLNNLALALQIKNNTALIDIGNATSFGGSLQSTIQIKPEEEQTAIEARLTGANLDITQIANTFGRQTEISGNTAVNLTLNTHFKTLSELTNNMQGQVTLNMLSGKINGYNLANLFDQWLKTKNFTLEKKATNLTNFDRLNIEGTFTQKDFTLTNSNISFGDWTITSSGTILPLPTENNAIFHLQSHLTLRQDTMCQTIACLQYTLQQPIYFAAEGDIFPNHYLKINN